MEGPVSTPPLTWGAANTGIHLPGGGAGPLVAVVFATVEGIVPADCELCTIQLFPSSRFSTGAVAGSIVVTCTYTNSGDDKIYNITGGGSPSNLIDGFWGQKFRAVVACDNPDAVTVVFTVEWLPHDIFSFPTNLTEQTTTPNLTGSTDNHDTNKKENEVTFTYNNTAAENPTSIAVVQTKNGVKTVATSVPFVTGIANYTAIDATLDITDNTPVTYTTIPYKLSPQARTVESEPSGVFDIIITMGLAFTEDFSSVMVMLANPSGIYTLVAGKTHDTLYERTGVTHVDIAIPEPFGRSGYVP